MSYYSHFLSFKHTVSKYLHAFPVIILSHITPFFSKSQLPLILVGKGPWKITMTGLISSEKRFNPELEEY